MEGQLVRTEEANESKAHTSSSSKPYKYYDFNAFEDKDDQLQIEDAQSVPMISKIDARVEDRNSKQKIKETKGTDQVKSTKKTKVVTKEINQQKNLKAQMMEKIRSQAKRILELERKIEISIEEAAISQVQVRGKAASMMLEDCQKVLKETRLVLTEESRRGSIMKAMLDRLTGSTDWQVELQNKALQGYSSNSKQSAKTGDKTLYDNQATSTQRRLILTEAEQTAELIRLKTEAILKAQVEQLNNQNNSIQRKLNEVMNVNTELIQFKAKTDQRVVDLQKLAFDAEAKVIRI